MREQLESLRRARLSSRSPLALRQAATSCLLGLLATIGVVHAPPPGAINVSGLDVSGDAMNALLEVDDAAWSAEMEEIRSYLESYGERLPAELLDQLDRVVAGLSA